MFAGGAGGKGTWGKLGSEALDEDFVDAGALDPNDPNYDDLNPHSNNVTMNVTEVALKKIPRNVSDVEICVSTL